MNQVKDNTLSYFFYSEKKEIKKRLIDNALKAHQIRREKDPQEIEEPD